MELSGFEINEEIGGGGAHRFSRARRMSDGCPVLLRRSADGAPQTGERTLFERELEICRDLEVPGVLTALDLVGSGNEGSGNDPMLVLADAPGVPLDQVLRQRGVLPLVASLEIGRRLAGTLSELHRRDVVHRDLRPANIIYDAESRQTHLTGLGRASRVPGEAWRIRAPNRLEGDPVYLAPEATGRLRRQLDYRADLYSLGVVLFEMLTGRPPFDTADPMALVHAHITLDPPDPGTLRPGIPAVVSAILHKLLAKTAEERYQSSLGLAYDLERCLEPLAGEGEIDFFEPGEHDAAERFEFPQTLIGREMELRWLEDALESAPTRKTPTRKKLRLVSGHSGVGKTSLVEEVRLSVVRRQGLFASGKCDPGATPYDAILNALHDLIEQKLGEPPDQVEAWLRRLREELGPNLGVMTELLPALQRLVGESPPVPDIRAENSRNRFYRCVGAFLATLSGDAVGEAPLVLFLDDLQWVDPASMELVSSLLTGDAGSFLLLGAYRDNEVGKDHLLTRAVEALSSRGADVDTLRLSPLTESALARLVAEALRLPPSETAPLAELVYRKTAGNPFFVRTFLSTLDHRRLLRLTSVTLPQSTLRRRTWDLQQIASLEATENVIELVAHRLTELPPTARRTVAVASMLGKKIDVSTLAAVCGTREAESILIEACHAGLLMMVDGHYTFVHDRVREGAYELLREKERTAIHLRIGRFLQDEAGSSDSPKTDRDLFEIVDHLNQAAHLLADPVKRLELSRLNAEAGRQARALGAFATAYDYLNRAIELLDTATTAQGADPWREDYELTLTLHAAAVDVASLSQNDAAVERLSDVLLANARHFLDSVPAYEARITMHNARHEEEAAIRVALDIVDRLGIKISFDPDPPELRSLMLATRRTVQTVLDEVEEKSIQALPVMRDPSRLAATRLLVKLTLITSWGWVRLFRFAICRFADLTVSGGIGPATPIAYISFAEALCGELNDLTTAQRIGELVLKLVDDPSMKALAPNTRMLYDLVLSARTLHPISLPELFAEHFRRSMDFGDQIVATSCVVQIAYGAILGGRELAKTETLIHDYLAKSRGDGHPMLTTAIQGLAKLVARFAWPWDHPGGGRGDPPSLGLLQQLPRPCDRRGDDGSIADARTQAGPRGGTGVGLHGNRADRPHRLLPLPDLPGYGPGSARA